jgi:hypothetical protein
LATRSWSAAVSSSLGTTVDSRSHGRESVRAKPTYTPHIGGTSSVRVLVLAALAVAGLFAVGGALASRTYADATDDQNDAPDITSVSVSESAGGTGYVVRLALRSAAPLPAATGLVLLLDLDLTRTTGAGGAEAALRYGGDGTLSLLRWDGFQMVAAPTDGMHASFVSGVLTVAIERSALGGTTSFGIRAVASRAQTVAGMSIVASDYAPDSDASVFVGAGPKVFSDPERDEDAAPDISAIDVSDAANGTITFRITTSNYGALGADKLVGIGFQLVGRPKDADEMFITYQGGPEASVIVEREVGGLLTQDTPPDRVTVRFETGVVIVEIHRSELTNVARFGFGIVTADLVGENEGEGDNALGNLEAVDFSPDDLQSGTLHQYALEHRPPLRLTVGRPRATPAVPRAGKAFAVDVVVTRSDTGTAVRTGSVSCSVFVGKARVQAKGRFRAGKAQCSLVVPAERRSQRIRGTMTVRAAGASVRSGFSFRVG